MTEPLHPDELEVAPGSIREELQGWVPDLASAEQIRVALEKAFHYRGDITITCKDGELVEGYIFDRRPGTTLEHSLVRLILKDTGEKMSIPYSDIARLAFTGRDTAAGKSWEAWVGQYLKRKQEGECNISLEPESLE